jgi:hypothetical protein
VRVHLHHRGYDDVVFEPIPNSPPDFVVNKHIGIEVRRLNHNYVNVEDGVRVPFLPNKLTLTPLRCSQPFRTIWFVRWTEVKK